MHDPDVVAITIPSPLPRRKRYRDAREGERRWTLGVRRRTNAENLGERVYPWWRLAGYEPRLAGRAFGLNSAITIWHHEPGGRDAFTVCKHGWKWHVRHWRVQVHLVQQLRRRFFVRCDECKRRFPWTYGAIGVGWDDPRILHRECHGYRSLLRARETDEQIIRWLASAQDEPLPFHAKYRLETLLDPEKVNG